MPAVIIGISLVFKMLMLVDAMRRHGCCGNPWYFIILFPFGEWVYFFMVKIHDPEVSRFMKKLVGNRNSFEKIQYEASHCPSQHNLLQLAKAAHDNQKLDIAIETATKVLSHDSKNKEALLVLAHCEAERKNFEAALAALQKIVDTDFSYQEGRAVELMSEIRLQLGQTKEAIDLLSRLLKQKSSIQVSVNLARAFLQESKSEEAASTLKRAIDDHKFAPRFLKRRERGKLKQANELLRSIRV